MENLSRKSLQSRQKEYVMIIPKSETSLKQAFYLGLVHIFINKRKCLVN